MPNNTSGRNIPPGIFSKNTEIDTPAVIAQDSELQQLQHLSPGGQQLQTISDPEERERQYQKIDELYEFRNSIQYEEQEKKRQNKQNVSGLEARPSDIYPPKPLHYNPNFADTAEEDGENPNKDDILDNTDSQPAMVNIKQTLQRKREQRDAILDNTPSQA